MHSDIIVTDDCPSGDYHAWWLAPVVERCPWHAQLQIATKGFPQREFVERLHCAGTLGRMATVKILRWQLEEKSDLFVNLLILSNEACVIII